MIRMDAYILDQFIDKKKGPKPLKATLYNVGGEPVFPVPGAVGLTALRYSPILVLLDTTSSPSLLVQVSSLW